MPDSLDVETKFPTKWLGLGSATPTPGWAPSSPSPDLAKSAADQKGPQWARTAGSTKYSQLSTLQRAGARPRASKTPDDLKVFYFWF